MRIEDKKQPAYTDLDRMPFGKHKGEPMQDVPAHYLRWLWTEGDCKQYCGAKVTGRDYIDQKIRLANYIWNSQDELQSELDDTFI
jgi:uncharacterized protein (DUF3820 family)